MNIGDKYGELRVLGRPRRLDRTSGNPKYVVQCRCSCGAYVEVEKASLVHGRSKTCGHLRRRVGPENPGWKGGKTKNVLGYVVINGTKTGGKYPNRKLEHRAVMEKVLGRPLLPSEKVHHRNGIRNDNRPENLEVWVTDHPPGAQVDDCVQWAIQILKRYAPERLS